MHVQDLDGLSGDAWLRPPTALPRATNEGAEAHRPVSLAGFVVPFNELGHHGHPESLGRLRLDDGWERV